MYTLNRYTLTEAKHNCHSVPISTGSHACSSPVQRVRGENRYAHPGGRVKLWLPPGQATTSFNGGEGGDDGRCFHSRSCRQLDSVSLAASLEAREVRREEKRLPNVCFRALVGVREGHVAGIGVQTFAPAKPGGERRRKLHWFCSLTLAIVLLINRIQEARLGSPGRLGEAIALSPKEGEEVKCCVRERKYQRRGESESCEAREKITTDWAETGMGRGMAAVARRVYTRVGTGAR